MSKRRLFEQLAALPASLIVTGSAGAPIGGDPLTLIADELRSVASRRGKVWLFGNGGSAAVASHVANDIMKRWGIYASALCEAPTITAIANDSGYALVYEHQLSMCLGPDDLAVAISSSGASPNMIEAANVAMSRSRLLTLSGMAPDNPLRCLGHLNGYLPFEDYGAIEIGHLVILHECVWSSGSLGEYPS